VEAVALLSAKGHPNIVEVLDHGHISMVNYYIDMELCNLSLTELLKRKDKGEGLRDWYLQWPTGNREDKLFFIGALMQELANGLYFIHKHDQVHRDIKPENGNTLSKLQILTVFQSFTRHVRDGGSWQISASSRQAQRRDYATPHTHEGQHVMRLQSSYWRANSIRRPIYGL
jgi:serine/threonine protein kinase